MTAPGAPRFPQAHEEEPGAQPCGFISHGHVSDVMVCMWWAVFTQHGREGWWCCGPRNLGQGTAGSREASAGLLGHGCRRLPNRRQSQGEAKAGPHHWAPSHPWSHGQELLGQLPPAFAGRWTHGCLDPVLLPSPSQRPRSHPTHPALHPAVHTAL